MSLYTDDDLRDFVKFAKDYYKKLPQKAEDEEWAKLEDVVRLIISLHYNAMVFEAYIKNYSAQDYILSRDLSQLPLHINDEGLLSTVIVKWRLTRNK